MKPSTFTPGKPVASKPRSRKCPICLTSFVKQRPMQVVCSLECSVLKVRVDRDKVERRELKIAKEVAKPLKDHLKEAEKAVNLYVRLRDRHLGCISCDKPSHWDGQWHASHFKSVGSNSTLRYHLWNIHRSCSACNLFKSGNIAEYEKRLVLKIGADRVEWLKRQNGVKRYDAGYLIRLKKVFTKKAKRLAAKAHP